MLWHASSGLLFAAALYWVRVYGQVDAPSPNNFIRRNAHSVTVLGDYAYIDGGEVSQYASGELEHSNMFDYQSLPMNSTLSIPLNESWNSISVSFQTTKKDSLVPRNKGASLWANPAADTLTTFGGDIGQTSETYVASRTALWVFTPDGRGGGTWANPGADGASGLVRRANSASVVCAGTALQLGGWGGYYSDPSFGEDRDLIPVPGLVSYDLPSSSSGSGSWSNTSGAAFVEYLAGGSATCLPSFGQAGLAAFMGGLSTGADDVDAGDQISLANLTFYDPQSGRWHWQTTGGQTPQPRQQPCVVAVEGLNGTSEIFIYGGFDSGKNTSLSDVWVLTIPGFQWFQGDSSGTYTERVGHQCVVGGKGNRQMISIGGLNVTYNGDVEPWGQADPWPNGVGVLDLPSMTWTNAYNATAATYDSPHVVQDWYSSGNLESVQWSSDEVKSLFMAGYKPSNRTTGNDTVPSQSPSPSTGKTNTGAIAGGVVGGVAAVALLAGLAYYLIRVRHRRHPRAELSTRPDTEYQYAKVEPTAEEPNELPAHSSPGELSAYKPPGELPAHSRPGELPG